MGIMSVNIDTIIIAMNIISKSGQLNVFDMQDFGTLYRLLYGHKLYNENKNAQQNVEKPEESAPEESTPVENVPEESAPEESAPEENAPEESAPQENVPEESVQKEVDEQQADNSEDNYTINFVENIDINDL